MYYWGDNYKMQTSHTLCSRPKRYGALQRCSRADVNARVKATLESAARVTTPRRRRGYVHGRVFVGTRSGDVRQTTPPRVQFTWKKRVSYT